MEHGENGGERREGKGRGGEWENKKANWRAGIRISKKLRSLIL
jgi:hypothetical protein